jgi:2-iminoacetate synthase ThiH
MPEIPSRDELIEVLTGHDPVAAGKRASTVSGQRIVTYTRADPPADWLLDGEEEGSLTDHAAAHDSGTTSEAVVAYGAEHTPEQVAERLLGLAELAARSDLLVAVCPIPDDGDHRRPGSWGVEDLSVIAATRLCLPSVRWIRPSWRLLGAPACQVAVAFGANDWRVPADDQTDLEHLASAVGAQAVER